jgi:hypothetical protein
MLSMSGWGATWQESKEKSNGVKCFLNRFEFRIAPTEQTFELCRIMSCYVTITLFSADAFLTESCPEIAVCGMFSQSSHSLISAGQSSSMQCDEGVTLT